METHEKLPGQRSRSSQRGLGRVATILSAFWLVSVGLPRGNDRDSCLVPILHYTSGADTVDIGVVQNALCQQYFAKGFLIVEQRSSLGWVILWGKGESEHCQTQASLEDLDGVGAPEILTLFSDESNVWGYIHRVQEKDDSLEWQHLALPTMLTDDTALTDGSLYERNPTGGLTLLGTTYDSVAHPVVSYSTEADSLMIEQK